MSWLGILKYLPPPSRYHWPLRTLKSICVMKVKCCKIDLLLKWSTGKVYSASKLCLVLINDVSNIYKYNF